MILISTRQQYLLTLNVDGQNIGVFDTRTGGDSLAPAVKHRPGGMGPEKSYPSLAVHSDVTVSRVYERQRDHDLLRTLTPKAGKATASLTEQPLDPDGNAWGKPIIYRGRFLGIKRGDVDSTATDPRMFEIDFTIETVT